MYEAGWAMAPIDLRAANTLQTPRFDMPEVFSKIRSFRRKDASQITIRKVVQWIQLQAFPILWIQVWIQTIYWIFKSSSLSNNDSPLTHIFWNSEPKSQNWRFVYYLVRGNVCFSNFDPIDRATSKYQRWRDQCSLQTASKVKSVLQCKSDLPCFRRSRLTCTSALRVRTERAQVRCKQATRLLSL